MTPHDHTTFVPGCYRCELGRDEARDAETEDCAACNGEGYTFAVYGQLDTYEECERCDNERLNCEGCG